MQTCYEDAKKDAATAFEMKRNIHINSMSVIYCMQDASNERIRGKKSVQLKWFSQRLVFTIYRSFAQRRSVYALESSKACSLVLLERFRLNYGHLKITVADIKTELNKTG